MGTSSHYNFMYMVCDVLGKFLAGFWVERNNFIFLQLASGHFRPNPCAARSITVLGRH
jgi:hypothetical protein